MNGWVGQRLGKYEIQAELGRGGMGIVYRGYDAALRRPVAIKVLPPQLTYDAQFVQRFQQEAILAANLRHPNIVTIYDVGQEGDVYYIVMEYLEGITLEALLARQGSMPFDQALHVLRQVADALDAAHSRGIIHRDVKPANIMIGPDGRATLMDFGLVRAAEGTSLTRSGIYMGTPEYMAPEQALGESVGPTSDIYSLGVVLYKMLCGKVPFSRSTPLGVTYAHVNEPPPPLRTIRADVPPAVEAVVNKALAKKPAARYQTANVLAADYRAAIGGALPTAFRAPTPTPAKTGSPPENQETVIIGKQVRAARRVPIALIGIVTTLALIGVVILTQMLRSGQSGAKSAQVTLPATQFDSLATSTPAPIRPGTPNATAIPGSSAGMPAPTSTMQPTAPNTAAPTALRPSTQPKPTALPASAPSPTERANPQIRVTSDSANLRNGPGTSYLVVGQAKQGDALPISARSVDGGWWQVCCVNGQSAWVSTQVVAVEGDTSGVQTARDVAPPPTAPPQSASNAQCKPWHKKPKPGYGIIMIENHLGEELSADYAVGGTGHWMIAAKKSDEPGRWWKEVPIGDHVINYSTPFGYGRAAFRVENSRSYVSPLWYNDRADDYVFPMEIPTGCQ
jgi:serine/threonine-protein kinase